MNESSHQSLERLVGAALAGGEQQFSRALRNATVIHNAAPHSATGESPYFALFGTECVMPGWQALAYDLPEEVRKRSREVDRQIKMAFAMLRSDRKIAKSEEKREKYEIGEWIVFMRSDYELKQTAAAAEDGSYTAAWSLPAKILKIGRGQLTVRVFGTEAERIIPFSQVRRLSGVVAPSSQKINLREILRHPPRRQEPPGSISSQKTMMPPISWRDFMENVPTTELKRSGPRADWKQKKAQKSEGAAEEEEI